MKFANGKVALIIFFTALALRLGFTFAQPESFQDEDEIVYTTVAWNFLAGRGLILTRHRLAAFPPLYPLFLAGLFKLGITKFIAVRVVQAILGAFSCILLMGISKEIFEEGKGDARGAGTVSGILMAVYPLFIFYCAQLMAETLFVFLLLAGLYALMRHLRSPSPLRWIALAGAFMGLGVLCRPALLPFALLAIVWLAVARPARNFFSKKLLSYIIPLILVLLPWEVRNYRLFSEVIPVTSSGGKNLYLANNPLSSGGTVGYRELMEGGIFHLGEKENEIAYDRDYRKRALDFIKENPGRFLLLSLKRLAWFYHFDYHYRGTFWLIIPFHVLLILSVAGIWLSRLRWRRASLLLFLIASFTVVHMVFLPEGRYRLPLVPALLAFASVALARAVSYRIAHRA